MYALCMLLALLYMINFYCHVFSRPNWKSEFDTEITHSLHLCRHSISGSNLFSLKKVYLSLGLLEVLTAMQLLGKNAGDFSPSGCSAQFLGWVSSITWGGSFRPSLKLGSFQPNLRGELFPQVYVGVDKEGAINHHTAPHDTPRHPTSLNYFIVWINYMTKLLQGISFMYQNLFLY